MPNLDPFDGQDHSNDIVIYRSVIGIGGVEQSSLWVTPSTPEPDLRTILIRPAGFIRFPWPPAERTSLKTLALLRINAGLELTACGPVVMTSADAKADLYTRVPALPRPEARLIQQYARYKLCAAIDREGEHSFFVLTASKGLPLPLKDETLAARPMSHGALTDFLQSMARIDVMSQVEQISK